MTLSITELFITTCISQYNLEAIMLYVIKYVYNSGDQCKQQFHTQCGVSGIN